MPPVRTYTAAGFLVLAGLFIMWAGFAGRLGVVLGAVLSPADLILAEEQQGG